MSESKTGRYRRRENKKKSSRKDNGSKRPSESSEAVVKMEASMEACFVCREEGERMSFVCVGPCNHALCSVCSLRMRFVEHNRSCALCKRGLPFVICFDRRRRRPELQTFESFGLDEMLPPEGQTLPGLVYDFQSATLYFQCKAHNQSQRRMRQWRCKAAGCTSQASFPSSDALSRHLYKQHRGHTLCRCCLEGRPLFPEEHELFLSAQTLAHHTESVPHPPCRFCRMHFFDAQAFLQHLQLCHVPCSVCPQPHPQLYTFYKDLEAVREHALKDHFCCRLCLQASANENVQYEFAFADRAALLMHLQGVHALEVNSRGHVSGYPGGSAAVSNLDILADRGRARGFQVLQRVGAKQALEELTVDATSADPNRIRPETLAEVGTAREGRGGGGEGEGGGGGGRRRAEVMQSRERDVEIDVNGERIPPVDATHDRLPRGMQVAGRVTGSGVFQRRLEGELGGQAQGRDGAVHANSGRKGKVSVANSRSRADFPDLRGSGSGSGSGSASAPNPSSSSHRAPPTWGFHLAATAAATVTEAPAATARGKSAVTAPLTAKEVAVFKSQSHANCARGGAMAAAEGGGAMNGTNSRAELLRKASPAGSWDDPSSSAVNWSVQSMEPFEVLSGIPAARVSDDDFLCAMDADVVGASMHVWATERLRVAVRRFAQLEYPLYPPFLAAWAGKSDEHRRLVLQMETKLAELLDPAAGPTMISAQLRSLPSAQRAVLTAYACYFNVRCVEKEVDFTGGGGQENDTRRVLSFTRLADSRMPTRTLSAVTALYKGVHLVLQPTLRDKNVPRIYFAVRTSDGASVGATRQIFRVDDVLRLVVSVAKEMLDDFVASRTGCRRADEYAVRLDELTVESLGLVRDVVTIGAGAVYVEFDTVATAAAVFARVSEAPSAVPVAAYFSMETGFSRAQRDRDLVATGRTDSESGRRAVERALCDMCGRMGKAVMTAADGWDNGTPPHHPHPRRHVGVGVGVGVGDEAEACGGVENRVEDASLMEVEWDDSSDEGGAQVSRVVEEGVKSRGQTEGQAAGPESVPMPMPGRGRGHLHAPALDDWSAYLAAKRAKNGQQNVYRAPTGDRCRSAATSAVNADAKKAPASSSVELLRQPSAPTVDGVESNAGTVFIALGGDDDDDDDDDNDDSGHGWAAAVMLSSSVSPSEREHASCSSTAFLPPLSPSPSMSCSAVGATLSHVAGMLHISEDTVQAAVEVLSGRRDGGGVVSGLSGLATCMAGAEGSDGARPLEAALCTDCIALEPTLRQPCVMCQALARSVQEL